MDGAGLNGNGTQGFEGNGHSLNGNEAEHVQNNCEEGSSTSSSAPVDHETMKENPELEMDVADANSKAPSPQRCAANPPLPQSSNYSAYALRPGFYIERASDLLIVVSLCAEETKRKICDLAFSAMDELLSIAYAGKPLWKPLKGHKFEVMDNIEYLKHYCKTQERPREIATLASYDYSLPHGYVPTPNATPTDQHVNVEASRQVRYVKINPIDLVRSLMDMNQWRANFFNIVSRAASLGIMTNGVQGSYNGRLQVISSEFQLPTPLFETWECIFARYSKKLSTDTWVIVDVPLHEIFPPTGVFRRRPSGCLIQELINGYSKVTWVEHVVADHSKLNIHFQPLVSSGLAFGATRWLASLVRSISCSETLKAENIRTVLGNAIPQKGRAGLLKVAGRMTKNFFADISASSSNRWTKVASLQTSEDLRVNVKNIIHGFWGMQGAIATLIFAATIWLPTSPQRLFDFFHDVNSRSKWDLYSSNFPTRELTYIIQGNDPRNRVSILHVHGDDATFYLQESYRDATGSSYMVYAPVSKLAMSNLLNGGNPDIVTIIPSGFTILPHGLSSGDDNNDCNGGGGGGSTVSSILTIACYMINSVTLTTPVPIVPPVSVVQATQFMNHIVTGIKDAVLNGNA